MNQLEYYREDGGWLAGNAIWREIAVLLAGARQFPYTRRRNAKMSYFNYLCNSIASQ